MVLYETNPLRLKCVGHLFSLRFHKYPSLVIAKFGSLPSDRRYCTREWDERVNSIFTSIFLRELICIEFKALHAPNWSLGAHPFVLLTLLVWHAVPVLGGVCFVTQALSLPAVGS